MDFLSADAMPWLQSAQQRLADSKASGRAPHSLLILSVPGLGAEALAQWFGALMLCESPQSSACGHCASCQLLRADSHPDWHALRLEEDAQQLKIEQVRELIETMSLKSFRGGYKVAVIESAEALNTYSANAFLKTLEEPPQNTLLIMIARPSHRLPVTIASRCLRLSLRRPSSQVALDWLKAHAARSQPWDAALMLARGAPLEAQQLDAGELALLEQDMHASVAQLGNGSVDVTLMAERWMRSNPDLRIHWLENWITQRVQAALGNPNSSQIAEPVRLPATLLKAKIRPLFELLDAAREFRRLATTGLNQQLALEALLIGGRTALTM
jgi:DNA polymerase III subunit delta'